MPASGPGTSGRESRADRSGQPGAGCRPVLQLGRGELAVRLGADAAHLITPAGGKGMNLAIQDAVELAHGLTESFGPRHDDRRLAGYSRTRLPLIWRTQAYSNWHLRLILSGLQAGHEPAGVLPGGYANGLRQGWITALQHDPLFASWFAHAYVGVDPD